ncbi:MAG: HPr(Ser) kinase/phosphatase [Elusimicrobia bacterium RIFOXYB2_FULL_50_12]|nr:MAG: HPr(Ser) kinase/phosphatase [Elusimicrobia bacterium RIFOXYB2_FULL_50_12]
MPEITVGTFLQEKSEDLKLELITGVEGLPRLIKVSEINRPGLAFTGYMEHFPAERIQIIGLSEYSYLSSLAPEILTETLERILSYPSLPCVILAREFDPLPEMLRLHQKFKIPLLRTGMKPSPLAGELIFYLEDKMAASTSLHGVLVSVYGLGVLLIGNAGIGKSECAMELVKRGHMLVADDVVEVRQRSGGILIGQGEEIVRHHMEVRGLGIIDVRSLFGIGFILDQSKIELVIRLEDWDANREYERVGLEEHYTNILDVKVPEVILPVRPGRNLAVLVEIASLNQRLKNRGHYTAQQLNQRLIQIMSQR